MLRSLPQFPATHAPLKLSHKRISWQIINLNKFSAFPLRVRLCLQVLRIAISNAEVSERIHILPQRQLQRRALALGRAEVPAPAERLVDELDALFREVSSILKADTRWQWRACACLRS